MVQLISENRFEEVRPMLSEDVELDIHGFGPWCGSWRGADSAAATLERNFMMVTNQRPRITSLIVDGEHLAVQVEESGVFVEAETNYSIRGLMWCQFRDGKLLRFEEHVVSVAVPPEGTP
jgi:ketosteroid isomerase-like protein